jgi:hypothetical protein
LKHFSISSISANISDFISEMILNQRAKITKKFGKEFFDDVLGMSPSTANFFASFVSHTLLASAYYIGLSSITMPANYTGANYTKSENRSGNIGTQNWDVELGGGGSSANYMKLTSMSGDSSSAKYEFVKSGIISSDIAFKGTPGAEQIFTALNVRHTAALVNVGGTLRDSAASISLIEPLRGAIYASPWTGTCHSATFNTLKIDNNSSGLPVVQIGNVNPFYMSMNWST